MVYKNVNFLGSYLAGLWEGDGSVKMIKNAKPTISISFHKNEAPVAEKLLAIITNKCNNIRAGSVHYHKKRLACYLNIYSIEGLKYFITLVNGTLRTPKAYQINYIIDWLNQKHNTNIQKLPLSNLDLSEDAWLAGFIDADGSFAIRQTLKSKITKKQTKCQFILVQRTAYPKKTGGIRKDPRRAYFLCVKLVILRVILQLAINIR